MFRFNNKISAAVCGILLSFFMVSCAKPGDSIVQQAVTSYGSGKYEEALGLFNKALETETRYSKEMIYTMISNVYAAQDDFENATVWLEKSLDLKPDYRGYVTLGMNYQSIKNYSKSEENYKKAIEMNGQKGEAWASLGMMYLETGNPEKAVECLEKGIEFAPKIAVIHAYLAAAYGKTGRLDDCAAEFAEAEKLNCSNLDQIREKFGF